MKVRSITVSAAIALTVVSPLSARSSQKCDGPNAPIKIVPDSANHAVVITLGPCLVPSRGMMHMQDMGKAGMMEHGPGNEDVRVHFPWPTTAWLRSFDLQLFDKNHQRLNQSSTIHHLELLNLDRRQIVYPMVERLFGIGEETDPVKLPKSVGVPIDAGMDIAMYVMWNNQTDKDIDGVTVQLTLRYSPRNLVPRPTSVLPFKVDVNSRPGAGDAFTLPPGGGSRATTFTVAVSGRLLAAGGHLHDFGKEVRLEDVVTGKVLARVTARRTPSGEVTGVSHSLYGIRGRGPHLVAGREYRLVTTYEGSPNDSIHGAMGLMGGIFAPDDYTKLPQLDRTHPDYILDITPKGQAAVEAVAPPASGTAKENGKP